MPSEPGKSSVYEFPWPGDSQAPNGPLEFEELAKKADAVKWLSRSLKPVSGVRVGSGAIITLTGSYQDVTGTTLEITPEVASYIRINAVFGLNVQENNAVAIPTEALGTMSVDGVDQTSPLANLSVLVPSTNAAVGATVAAHYLLPLSAAKHTIKMRAKKNTGENATIDPSLTCFSYDLISQ